MTNSALSTLSATEIVWKTYLNGRKVRSDKREPDPQTM
jgi:hypothetical protein